MSRLFFFVLLLVGSTSEASCFLRIRGLVYKGISTILMLHKPKEKKDPKASEPAAGKYVEDFRGDLGIDDHSFAQINEIKDFKLRRSLKEKISSLSTEQKAEVEVLLQAEGVKGLCF